MKYLKLFEAFNQKFDAYEEVGAADYENWSQNHNPESFKRTDTLAILDIIESLWNKKSVDLDFYKNNQKISTPVKTLFRNDQIWDVEENIFTREEFNRIEAYDNYHYFQIEKWEDEWYTVYYDTYGGGHPHYFIVDTQEGIDWLQDKMSTIYSDVYENGIDESKEVVMKATLTNDDNELIEDLILEFVEKWGIERSKFQTNAWNIERTDRFQIWLQFILDRSKRTLELLSDMKKMIERIEKFGYNVSSIEKPSFRQTTGGPCTTFTFVISHKVEESTITSLTTEDDVERYRSILDDVSDLLITEMTNWNFIEYDTNYDYHLHNEMHEHPEKDFVFRVRLASWMGHKSGMEHSICIDVVYNTELWANSTGKTAPRLIHDLWKFSRKCVQKLGLTVRPFNKDMSNYDTFFSKITHFHTTGELRFYMGYDDEGTRITNESNMPQKFEADDEMAIIKWSRFKEEHSQIEFTQSQRNQIQNLLDKSKFSHRWWSGLNGGPEALQIVYNKWTNHEMPQWKSGFNKYVVDISAREDEWFLISQVNNTYGYTDIYLADQFDQVIEFIKSLDPDTDIEANPFGFNQF